MIIESFEEIRSIIGSPNPVLEKKIYPSLNPRMIRFVENSSLVFISTIDKDGFPTISPKGDDPGFIKIADSSRLLIPERKGNKLAYTFQNILAGSKVALLFVVPGTNEVLRVHGSAKLINDSNLNAKLASKSQLALLATEVSISHCYFHCGKAFLRSKLFSSDVELQDMRVSLGTELAENKAIDTKEADEFDSGVLDRYKTDL